MKRSQLVAAIALSVGLSGWFHPLHEPAALAGDCNAACGCQCQCSHSGHGLLDKLDAYASKMNHSRSHSPSILGALTKSLSKSTSGCDCGEPTCGIEAAPGRKAVRGTSANCAPPSCDCGEPTCGIEAAPGRKAVRGTCANCAPLSCDCGAQPHVVAPHAHRNVWPAETPRQSPHAIPYSETLQPRMSLPKVPPVQNPPVQKEHVPVPEVQDSTVDPFRDDTALNSRPSRLPVRSVAAPLPQRKASSAQSQRGLTYDPQSRLETVDRQDNFLAETPLRHVVSNDVSSRRVPLRQGNSSGAPVQSASQSQVASLVQTEEPASQVVPAAASEPTASRRRAVVRVKTTSDRPADVARPNPLRDR